MATTQHITQHLARTKAAAQHFQISKMTLWRWRQQDGFPQPFKRGQTVLYDLAAIEQWLAVEGER